MAIKYEPKDGGNGGGKAGAWKGAYEPKAKRSRSLPEPERAMPVLGRVGASVRPKRQSTRIASTHLLEREVPSPNVKLSPVGRKRGRPRIEDAANTLKAEKPWLALGMSRSTWYLRQKEAREK